MTVNKKSNRKNTVEILLLKVFLAAALILLITGLFTPIMTVTQLIFLENSFSVISGLQDLFSQQQYVLFLLISILSVCLPIIKIFLLAWVLHDYQTPSKSLKKTIQLIHNYGRWAMLDVFVIAMLLVSIKLGAIASVEIHAGLYWFSAAILITMIVTHRTTTLLERRAEP